MNVTDPGVVYGRFGTIDYTIFIVMLGVSSAIGVYFGFYAKGAKNAEEYLLGGRQMKPLPIAISLIASQLSGITIMAVPAEIYTFGSHYWVIVPVMCVVTVIINFIFIPVFYKNNLSNCYEYLEIRFSKYVRRFVTATFVFGLYLVLPVCIFIPALALAQVTGLNIHIINAIVCFICIFYTMMGGIKAVVWTDVVQAGIMIGSSLLVMLLGIQQIGGLDEVLRRGDAGRRTEIFNMNFDLTTRQTFWNVMLGYTFMWSTYLGLNQSCVQRIIAISSIQKAKLSLWLFLVGFIIIISINVFTGVVLYARYHDCDPLLTKVVEKADKLMPYFVQDVVGHLPGMPGVFISCVFSAGLSSMSAALNTLSGIVYEDYVRPLNLFKHTDQSANYAMKTLVVISGTYCILMGFFVEQFSFIFQMVMTISGIFNGATFGVFMLGMLWPRANKIGALCGTVTSVMVMAWIIIGSQIYSRQTNYKYPTLPTSVEGCDAIGWNVTHIIQNNSTMMTGMADVDADEFSIYKIAFPWYGFFGGLLVWIVGVPVTLFTGMLDIKDIKPHLITPLAHIFLPAAVRNAEIQMQQIQKESAIIKSNEMANSKNENWEWSKQNEKVKESLESR